MAIRILHLSDLHLINNSEHVNSLLTNLFNSMEQLGQDCDIDLVIFTGDMINKGGSSFGSISTAFSAFEELVIAPILEKLNLTKERFILIPGNHDTENDKSKTFIKEGILREFPHDNKASIITIKNLSQNGYPEMLKARTKAFKEFKYTYYADTLKNDYQYSDFESNYKFHINGHTVGVTGLNAVWLCGLDDDKEFYLGADQIVNSQAFLNDCDIKIIASHISYESLTEGERRSVKDLITKCYDLNLSGHTHATDDDFIISPDENFCMNIVASGTLSANAYTADEEYKNSFQVIDILSSTEFKVRKYIQKQGVDFSLDLNFGKNGVWHRKFNQAEMGEAIAEAVKEENNILNAIAPFKPIDKAIESDKKTFMSGPYIASRKNEECISVLKDNSYKSLRLLALSGIGKTRIAGEAFKGLANVFYSMTPEKIDSGLCHILENNNSGVIIIDDCPMDKHRHAIKIINRYQKDFRFISIYNVLTNEEKGIGENLYRCGRK